MGACTFTVGPNSNGDAPQGVTVDGKRFVEGTLALSTSYATGGDTIDLAGAGLGISFVDRIEVVGNNTCGLSFGLGGTHAAPKILAYETAATEVANATNISARSVRARLVGS